MCNKIDQTCAASGGGGVVGEGGGSSPCAGDSTIEINEWSGLLNYEQEVAVNQPFHDTIRYTPLIKKGTYVQLGSEHRDFRTQKKKKLRFMV